MCVCSYVVTLLGACSPSACQKRIIQVFILSAFWIDCGLSAQLRHELRDLQQVFMCCVWLWPVLVLVSCDTV